MLQGSLLWLWYLLEGQHAALYQGIAHALRAFQVFRFARSARRLQLGHDGVGVLAEQVQSYEALAPVLLLAPSTRVFEADNWDELLSEHLVET